LQERCWFRKLQQDLPLGRSRNSSRHKNFQLIPRYPLQSHPDKGTRHIDLAYHFLRENTQQQEVTFSHVTTERNVPDVMTKPLQPERFHEWLCKLVKQRTDCGHRLVIRQSRVYDYGICVMSAPWGGVLSAENVCKAKEQTKTCMMTTCYEAANTFSEMFVFSCVLHRHETTISMIKLFMQLLLGSLPV